MKANLGISPANVTALNKMLSSVLADAMVLYTKTRKFHWNVSGNSFTELHELFEEQYKQLESAIDEIAERIGKLGAKTPGTMKEFLDMASLKEHPGKNPAQKEMIQELMEDHEAVIRFLRKEVDNCEDKYKDKASADFLIDLVREHETMAWKLRRYF